MMRPARPGIRKEEGRDEERAAWVIVLLLFLFMFINGADKSILGLAAVPIMRDLGLTPSEFGVLGSSLFFLFAISAIATGFVVNRFGPRWPIFAMALVWAFAQLPMIGTVGFSTLLACRVLLGAGEGPAFPAAVHAVFAWFPDKRRSVPTAILLMGVTAALIAAPVITYVITRLSWHWAFGILGAAGILWSLAWLAFGRVGDISRFAPSYMSLELTRVRYGRLLNCATTLGVIACGFAAYSGISLLLVWFPSYLVDGLGLGAEEAGWVMSLPPVGLAVVQIIAAWLSQRAVTAGANTRAARALPCAFGAASGGIALCFVPLVHASAVKVALLVLGVSLPSAIYVLAYPMLSEFTPARQRGAVLATVNSTITMAGIVAPYVMGRFVDFGISPIAGYEKGFLYCGVFTLIGGLIGIIALHPHTELERLGRMASPEFRSRVPLRRRWMRPS